jgi:hypothetical protein
MYRQQSDPVTQSIESATALRNLPDAPADEEARPGAAAQGGGPVPYLLLDGPSPVRRAREGARTAT